jgi:LysM repeat protein
MMMITTARRIMRYFFGLIVTTVMLATFASPIFAQAPSQSQPAEHSLNVSQVHVVQFGETLFEIALQHQVPLTDILTLNGISNPNFVYAGRRLLIPPQQAEASGLYHFVKPNETVTSIANQYGIPPETLQAYNGLSNPNLIYVGQKLILPEPILADELITPTPMMTTALSLSDTLALSPTTSLTQAQTLTNTSHKEIVVDISQQRTYVYEGETLVYSFTVSTGEVGRETVPGSYRILNKIPMAYASTWDLQMPYWMGIYWAGSLQNGFHALPILPSGERLWDGYLGTSVSYGCIILSQADAQTLYEWAEVGTTVTIQP